MYKEEKCMGLVVQNVNVYLVDRGSGRPVLFLHGVPNTAEMWSDVIARLSIGYRCLAPDLPGFGRSIAPPKFDCSLENRADFINELVEITGINVPLNLVVHDHGGPYGLAWAVKHPEKVNRIVIMNTLFQSDYRWHIWARIWRTHLVGELSMVAINWPLFLWELRRGSRKLTREQIRHIYSAKSRMMKQMILRLYRATDPNVFVTWEDAMLKLTAQVPTLVLWGDQDPYIAKHFAERFGSQTVQHFPDCGHWLPIEAADEVSKRMEEFFIE
jgi:pimeloyl-ACP methyl ester carboxylesterase